MARFLKGGFHEEDRFDLLHARLTEQAMVTINQHRPKDKRVTVKGYAANVTPCGAGEGFYIKAESVALTKAKSVTYKPC